MILIGWRIALPLGLAAACALAAPIVVPRGIAAGTLLAAQDDPVRLADHALDRAFDATVAAREIRAALAEGDADLAQSFLDLARDRQVPVDPALAADVDAANTRTAHTARAASSFGRGLVTGEPDDLASFAGTAVGDLFVLGDIRDATREGYRLASGGEADELILGLSCVGIAITAGTYASLGAGTPARVGLSVVKAARRTGRMTASMADWLGRTTREVVDWGAMRQAVGGASLIRPVAAVRAVREAVKVENSHALVRLAGDLGRTRTYAGTRAALDALKVAEGPRDVARIARLAEAKGGKTRAILKLLGRGAIVLATSAFDLAWWVLWAVMSVLGFCSTCKRAAERMTERYLQRRKPRRAARQGALVAAPA
jgi:hypothetical protein